MKIGYKDLTYILDDVEQLHKINLLQGDSATGKSYFSDICGHVEDKSYGYFSTCSWPIHVIVKGADINLCNIDVQNHQYTLIIIDEDSIFLRQDLNTLQRVIYESSNKFIIISRVRKLESLPIEAVYTISYKERCNFITRNKSQIQSK